MLTIRGFEWKSCWFICCLITSLLAFVSPDVLAREIEARVVAVIDGDTLTCVLKGQQVTVDLKHIDAPEMSQPFGKEARAYLEERLGKTDKIFLEVAKKDENKKYFKALVYDANGKCVNFELLKNGLAWYVGSREATKETYYIYSQEKGARAQRRGLWSQKTPEEPWLWSARQKAVAPADIVVTKADERATQKVAQVTVSPTLKTSSKIVKGSDQENKGAEVKDTRASDERRVEKQPIIPVEEADRKPQDSKTTAQVLAESADQRPSGDVPLLSTTDRGIEDAEKNNARAAVKPDQAHRLGALLGTFVLIAALIVLLLVITVTTIPQQLMSMLRAKLLEKKVGNQTLIPFVIIGAVANADTSLKAAEQEAIDRFMDYLELNEEDRRKAMGIVRDGAPDLSTLKSLILRYMKTSGANRDLIDAMLLVCFVVASADGIFSAEEQIYLYLVCGGCGIEYEDYADKFMPEGGNGTLETLGIEKEANNHEQDAKIQRLLRVYNPAALRKQGLTAREMAFALDRYRAIEEASAVLREQRMTS